MTPLETPQQRFWANPERVLRVPDPELGEVKSSYVRLARQEWYLNLHEVSTYLTSLIGGLWPLWYGILELGCGPGRNLASLRQAGYQNVAGIEINPRSVMLARNHFPEIADRIHVGSIEEKLIGFFSCDAIFTQGVLMHIPPESDHIFRLISDKARLALLVNEVEAGGGMQSNLRFMRNYREIFEPLGWRQTLRLIPEVQAIGGSVTRVFERSE